MNTEQIMSQAQVFASAWALVGGRFDNGDMLETANEEKAELQTAIEALVQERDALKADALRWRYMRSKGANWFGVQEKAHDIDFDGGLDEAVDTAMKGKS